MSTRQLVHQMARQPQWAQHLIERMVSAIINDRATLSIPPDEMTASKQLWLEKNGFEYNYNKKLHEWEIELIDLAL